MDHLSANFERFIDDRIEICVIFDIVVVVVTASASKNEVVLQK